MDITLTENLNENEEAAPATASINIHNKNMTNKQLLFTQTQFIKPIKVSIYSIETLRLLNKNILENQLKILEERKLAYKNENFNVGILIDYMKRVIN